MTVAALADRAAGRAAVFARRGASLSRGRLVGAPIFRASPGRVHEKEPMLQRTSNAS